MADKFTERERQRMVELAAECEDIIGNIETRIARAREELGDLPAKVLAEQEQEQLDKARGLRTEIQQLIEARS